MATLKSSPTPADVDAGILAPLLENRFVVQYRSKNMTSEQLHYLSKQTVNFKMDFKNKLISFEIEQAAFGDMITDVQEFISNPTGVTMNTVDGGYNKAVTRIQFAMLDCVSHELALDYANAGVAKHKITMQYQSMTTKE